MPARSGRPSAADASIILRWTGCRGGSWCRILRRRGRRLRRGRAAGAGAARHLVPALGASACGARAGREAGRGAFVLARDAERARRSRWSTGSLDPARDVSGTAGHLTLTLPCALTGALLTRVPAAFHGGINDVLLTGSGGGDCGLVPAAWARGERAMRCCSIWRVTAARRCLRDVDLSRTVGWFTSLFPVRLDPGALDLDEALAGGAALGRALKRIKEQLRAVPGQRAGLWAAALSQPGDGGAACAALRRRRSASTIWGGLRRRRRRTGAAAAEAAAAWRRRSGDAARRMRSRSTR